MDGIPTAVSVIIGLVGIVWSIAAIAMPFMIWSMSMRVQAMQEELAEVNERLEKLLTLAKWGADAAAMKMNAGQRK